MTFMVQRKQPMRSIPENIVPGYQPLHSKSTQNSSNSSVSSFLALSGVVGIDYVRFRSISVPLNSLWMRVSTGFQGEVEVKESRDGGNFGLDEA